MRLMVLVAVLACCVSPAAADTQWLCLADLATGFRWNGERWVQASFNIDDNRYIISKSDGSPNYSVKTIGKTYSAECGAENEFGFIGCNVMFGTFVFNTKHLRFLQTYPVGFVDGKDNNDNTPSIEIGSCSVF